MDKNNVWLPLLTSIGVGAATYYTISKNNQSISQTVQKVIPLVSQMSVGGDMGQSQQSDTQNMS